MNLDFRTSECEKKYKTSYTRRAEIRIEICVNIITTSLCIPQLNKRECVGIDEEEERLFLLYHKKLYNQKHKQTK